MKTSTIMRYAIVAGGLVVCPGCVNFDALVAALPASTVTVTLQNDSADFSVDATIAYDNEEDTLEILVVQFGTLQAFSIPPGESRSITKSCKDLRALVLDNATLRTTFGNGPDTSSSLLRIGSNFECGDEVVFTFSHETIATSLRLGITIQ